MEYVLILLLLFVSGLALERYRDFRLYDSWGERLKITFFFLVVGTIWDSYAIARGHWSFNSSYLLFDGIRIGVMPLEEYLFILVVPFWILTVYTAWKQ